MTWIVHEGDCLDVLRGMDAASVDAVVTDPPYDLLSGSRNGSDRVNNRATPFGRTGSQGGFMGMKWDGTGIAFRPDTWREVLRIAKPGAHVVAFGGTRTYHRIACAIEDAGWEIRDSLMWLYGQGFPKSHNLDGKWDGWGTTLKPAFEPVILARKPLCGTVAANVERFGTGAINVDGCRIEGPMDGVWGASNHTIKPDRKFNGSPDMGEYRSSAHPLGRWPANVLLDEDAARSLDGQSGVSKSSGGRSGHAAAYSGGFKQEYYGETPPGFGDVGGASRFFYCAKASRSERGENNTHPTVKPIALMEWLIRLVSPPGGIVLDPFLGSGTTGVAAGRLGFDFVGIEKEASYVAIARRRITDAQSATDRQPALVGTE